MLAKPHSLQFWVKTTKAQEDRKCLNQATRGGGRAKNVSYIYHTHPPEHLSCADDCNILQPFGYHPLPQFTFLRIIKIQDDISSIVWLYLRQGDCELLVKPITPSYIFFLLWCLFSVTYIFEGSLWFAAALKCKLPVKWNLPKCKLHFPRAPHKKGGGPQKCIITFLTYQKMMRERKCYPYILTSGVSKYVSYI